MDGPPATIYVVDDDADVRATLAGLLRSIGYEPRTFASGTEFLAAHEPELSGCIILDLSVPGCSGLDILTRLTESGCRRPIIFLTANGSIRASVRAINAGAVNFLTKPVEEEELFTAVEEALLIDAMRRERESCAHALALRLKRLTPREREVLELVIAGRLNKQIAADLGVAERTIKVHRARHAQDGREVSRRARAPCSPRWNPRRAAEALRPSGLPFTDSYFEPTCPAARRMTARGVYLRGTRISAVRCRWSPNRRLPFMLV